MEEFLRFAMPGYVSLLSLLIFLSVNFIHQPKILSGFWIAFGIIGPVVGYIFHEIYGIFWRAYDETDSKRGSIKIIKQIKENQQQCDNSTCREIWIYFLDSKECTITAHTIRRSWHWMHSLGATIVGCGIVVVFFWLFYNYLSLYFQTIGDICGTNIILILILIMSRYKVHTQVNLLEEIIVKNNISCFQNILA